MQTKIINHEKIIKDYSKRYALGAILPIVLGFLGEIIVVTVLTLRHPISIAVFPISIVLIFCGTGKLSKFINELRILKRKQYSVNLKHPEADPNKPKETEAPKMIAITVSCNQKPLLLYNADAYGVDSELRDKMVSQ